MSRSVITKAQRSSLHDWLRAQMQSWQVDVEASSAVLDEVLEAYEGMSSEQVRELVSHFLSGYDEALRSVVGRYEADARRPTLLVDPALPCILERLEHDRYSLDTHWACKHDPRALRRIADLWGIRVPA